MYPSWLKEFRDIAECVSLYFKISAGFPSSGSLSEASTIIEIIENRMPKS